MAKTAQYWINKINLIAHPEGGYYCETYRSQLSIAKEALPPEFTGSRLVSTAIYFLLEGENFSAFHRLRSDELWHFHTGGTIVVHVIEPGGAHSKSTLGATQRPPKSFRQSFTPVAGSRPKCEIQNHSRSPDARSRRVSILRISNWGSVRSWSSSILNIEI